MAVWQEKRLGDIIRIKHGFAFKGEYISDEANGKVLVTPGNFNIGGGFKKTDKKFYYGEIPNDFILKPKDLIITMTDLSKNADTIGYSALIPNDNNIYLHNQRIGLVSVLDSNIDKHFIYWLLRTSSYQRQIANTSNGTNVKHTSPNRIYSYKCSIPDLLTQEKIADILSTYDDLIENNNRRIEILEQMAQEIYKEWFVRFRFPGHEKVKFVSSKLGKLPQTFNVVNAESLFEFYIGGGWGNENISENFPIEANVIRGTDIPNVRKYDISSCPVRYHKISNYKSRQLVSGDIVMEISGGTADQPVGRCALITQELIDRFKNGNVICASFCKLIRLNKNLISPYFCYYWLQYLYDTRIIDRFQLQSTGIINFKFEAFLKKGLIMLPPMDIMHQFENYVKYIVQEINMLASQNQNLIKQRDLLLPRLMSGKLEV